MITNGQLLRFADTPFGVFGYLGLYIHGVRTARFCTGEDDWLNNASQISCIPPGVYAVKRHISPHFGETFTITGVPGRGDILFHSGNSEEDTKGCTYLGEAFGGRTIADEDDPAHPVIEKWGIKGGTSGPAFKRFMTTLAGVDEWPLEVKWATPGEWRP